MRLGDDLQGDDSIQFSLVWILDFLDLLDMIDKWKKRRIQTFSLLSVRNGRRMDCSKPEGFFSLAEA